MTDERLIVHMFGEFYIDYGGRRIELPYSIHSVTVRLLVMIWDAGKKGITRDVILNYLYGENEIENPSNSMRVNIFRLRKMLGSLGLPRHEYIEVEHGIYRWNSEAMVLETDVENFTDCIRRAKTAERREKISLLETACDLYRGEFLPALSTEQWVIVKSMDCTKLYMWAVSELYDVYMGERLYEKAVYIADRAMKLHTYEKLAEMKIDALLAEGHFHKALETLDDISRVLFRDLGVMPSPELLERYEAISRHIGSAYGAGSVARKIKDHLDEPKASGIGGGGAYYCSFPSFVDSYRILNRISGRNGEPVFLIDCTMTDSAGRNLKPGNERLEKAPALMKAIEGALRSGDVYTRSNDNHFLIMLFGLTLKNCSTVTDRIEKTFHQSDDTKGIKLDFSIVSNGRSKK